MATSRLTCRIVAPSDDPAAVVDAMKALPYEAGLLSASPHLRAALARSGELLFRGTRWFVFHDTKGPAAVVPLRCEVESDGRLGVLSLRSLSRFEMLYADAALRADVSPRDVAMSLLEEPVLKGRRADVLRFRNLPPSSQLLKLARQLPAQFSEQEGSSLIDVGMTGEVWERQLSRNLRGQIRQSEKRLMQRGEIRLLEPTAAHEFDEAMARFVALEVAGYKASRNPLANEPGDMTALGGALRGHAALGTAHMLELYIGDALVASQFGVICGERLYLIKIAFNEAFADASPGTFLMGALLRRLADSRRATVVDCCVRQPWHARWHPHVETHTNATVPNSGTLRGAVLQAGRSLRSAIANRRG